MSIRPEDARHIALLARLALTPEEEAAFAAQLDHILEHFEKLKEIDTSGIEPTAHVVQMDTPFRDDVVTNEPQVEALLANAPERDGRHFKVPKIIE
jgi:aspartyl-tRNA(Asn)/glutamyl-tRNA(Gln) amidotransferase subunit C